MQDDGNETVDKWISSRASAVAISAIKQMAMLSARVPGAASLAWGLPSFPTPEPIRRAVEERLEGDPAIGRYALPDGLAELRRTIAESHSRDMGVEVDPDRNVMVTAGNMEGVTLVLQAILNPGDEVIVTDPCFASHIQQIRLQGGNPVFWPMLEDENWQPRIDGLQGLIGNRTKAILLVNPANPTGTILSETLLRQVAQLAQEHDLLIIVDDPYRHFLYDGPDCLFDLASLPELTPNLAYLFTFSKCFAMSGWRVGYMVLPEQLKRQVVKLHDLTMICTPRIGQVAAIAALQGDQAHLAKFQEILAGRRELICARLDRLGDLFSYVRPRGAYYVFPKLRADYSDSAAFAIRLLNEAQVTVTPGAAFGPSGEQHVRMAFCVEDATIDTAFDRIEAWWTKQKS
ncbi:MAG: pyridoxal phosphate-dependent aminotransferase [Kiloniellales bacterium]